MAKGGNKYVNPADKARKEARKKELKKVVSGFNPSIKLSISIKLSVLFLQHVAIA